MLVPDNGRSVRVPGTGRIRSSTEKMSDEHRKIVESVLEQDHGRIRASTGKRLNPYQYRKTIGRVPKNSRISISTAKWWNPGEYREKVESVRVPKNSPTSIEK